MVGLKHRLHGEASEITGLDFEIRALENELATRTRITRGEQERLHVRQNLYDSEVNSLHNNLNKVVGLIALARDQMHQELSNRRVEGQRAFVEVKGNNEERLVNIQNEYQKAKDAQRAIIRDREAEIAGKPFFLSYVVFYFRTQSSAASCVS